MAFTRRWVITILIIVITAGVSLSAWIYTRPAPFNIEVIFRPTTPPSQGENILSIPGQRCKFLVDVTEKGGLLQGRKGKREAIEVSAQGPGGMVTVDVYPHMVSSGQVAELTVIPSIASINETLTLTITGKRHGLTQTKIVTIEVISGEDDLVSYAAEIRDMFIPWLSSNHPEFGITNETIWNGTLVNPRILVVMHYIFISYDWEMYVTWHVTTPPHDWARIFLRHRFSEVHSSFAFEISSVEAQEEPCSIEVLEWV